MEKRPSESADLQRRSCEENSREELRHGRENASFANSFFHSSRSLPLVSRDKETRSRYYTPRGGNFQTDKLSRCSAISSAEGGSLTSAIQTQTSGTAVQSGLAKNGGSEKSNFVESKAVEASSNAGGLVSCLFLFPSFFFPSLFLSPSLDLSALRECASRCSGCQVV